MSKRNPYPEEKNESMCIDMTVTHTFYSEKQMDLFTKFSKALAELKIKERPWLLNYEPYKSKAWRK